MRHFIQAAFVAAMLVVPVSVLADTAPPAPDTHDSGTMMQIHTQMDQARSQARTAALNALTSANRDLLARVVGGLATAPTPDINAAAKQLDAALSARESKAILDAGNSFEAQVRKIMDQAHAQMGGGPGGPGGPGMAPPAQPADPGQTDAGLTLLRLAVPPMGPPRMMIRGGPPGS